jgi:hypothetical protein
LGGAAGGAQVTAHAALCLLAASACSTSGGGNGRDKVDGSVAGYAFGAVASAYWIGAPTPGSPPVIAFVLEQDLGCDGISAPNWDKTIGLAQVIEVSVPRVATGTYAIGSEATVAYLRGDYNPDATSGEVALSDLEPQTRLAGTFHAGFGASDMLDGRFTAVYCPTGVEP